MPGKKTLNGMWNYIEDPNHNYRINFILNISADSDKFKSMEIPSNWEFGGLQNYHGSVWFIKKFSKPADLKSALNILIFKGIDYLAEVWINGYYLGIHEGYFQPFSFLIPSSFLKDSQNILILKVSSEKEEPGKVWPDHKKQIKGIFNHHDCRPGGCSPEFGQDRNTGGIWNDVELLWDYQLFINNIKITPIFNETDSSACINVNVNFIQSESLNKNIPVKFKIFSPNDKVYHKKGFEVSQYSFSKEISYTIRIKNPALWWPWDIGKQNLYRLEITSPAFHKQVHYFGIRKVKLDTANQFLINDKRLFLRGTNIIPEQYLSKLNKQRIKRLVRLIKEANINIVRVHAHVNRKEFYEECDKEGVLVWQDFALQWKYEESDKFLNNAVKQIKDMVQVLFNHPSIVFWCCHNEPGDQINTIDRCLYNAVREEDYTRIIRASSNFEEHPYDGWYWGSMENFASAPMGPLVTEFGAQALPERRSLSKFIPKKKMFPPKKDLWQYHNFQPEQTFHVAKIKIGNSIDAFIKNSQNYQAKLLKTAINFYRRKKNSGITGIFQFMFIDCWPSITWSIIDYYAKKKKGYYIVKKYYSPLLLSINLRQDEYYLGSRLNSEAWIINDRHIEYTRCTLLVILSGITILKIENIIIREDSFLYLTPQKLDVYIPNNLRVGRHKIVFMLSNKKKSNSLFVEEFEITLKK